MIFQKDETGNKFLVTFFLKTYFLNKQWTPFVNFPF